MFVFSSTNDARASIENCYSCVHAYIHAYRHAGADCRPYAFLPSPPPAGRNLLPLEFFCIMEHRGGRGDMDYGILHKAISLTKSHVHYRKNME